VREVQCGVEFGPPACEMAGEATRATGSPVDAGGARRAMAMMMALTGFRQRQKLEERTDSLHGHGASLRSLTKAFGVEIMPQNPTTTTTS
jgi:hypothetical protein